MAIASWALAFIALWGTWAQQRDARELLSVKIAIELDREFDSAEMHRARRTLASQLRKKQAVTQTRVLDFFDKVGMYMHQKRVDQETVYSAFSYWVEHYWVASRDYVENFREEMKDEGYYRDFEQLYGEMLNHGAKDRHKSLERIIPSPKQIQDFLEDEANLAR
jgi:hypothetical protein